MNMVAVTKFIANNNKTTISVSRTTILATYCKIKQYSVANELYLRLSLSLTLQAYTGPYKP